MIADATDPLLGRIIGPYRLDALLGEGATARVYRAHHQPLQKDFALKLFTSNVGLHKKARERFVREAKALALINNPHVVRLTDFGVSDSGRPYLVMEWIQANELRSLMGSLMHPTLVAAVCEQIARGLIAVHAAKVIHRDLKPANIVVTQDGTIKIVDFGLVCGAPESFPAMTSPDAILGTPLYMAPEMVIREEISERTDLYSLGVIMFEMLVGSPPFRGKEIIEILSAQLEKAPVSLAKDFGEVGALVDALLKKEPAARPASAREIADKLHEISAGDRVLIPALITDRIDRSKSSTRLADTYVSPRTLGAEDKALTPITPQPLSNTDSTEGDSSRDLDNVDPPARPAFVTGSQRGPARNRYIRYGIYGASGLLLVLFALLLRSAFFTPVPLEAPAERVERVEPMVIEPSVEPVEVRPKVVAKEPKPARIKPAKARVKKAPAKVRPKTPRAPVRSPEKVAERVEHIEQVATVKPVDGEPAVEFEHLMTSYRRHAACMSAELDRNVFALKDRVKRRANGDRAVLLADIRRFEKRVLKEIERCLAVKAKASP